MGAYECTEERFLDTVKNHQPLQVLRDDGVCRHLRLRESSGCINGFDLLTWPWHLCITGDMGTYVFSRTEDMFSFFRMRDGDFNKKPKKRLNINAGYWGEKLLSICKHGGFKEFDEERFRERVMEDFNNYWDGRGDKGKQECFEAIEADVLSRAEDGEREAFDALSRFEHEGFTFDDFFDGGLCERYTFHYIWCLYAIVWGIAEYDNLAREAAA